MPALPECKPAALTHPIGFSCTVEGKKLSASLTHIEDSQTKYIYHISFSDGYLSSFMTDAATGLWLDANHIPCYAVAITNDLDAIVGFSPQKLPFHLSLKHEGKELGIWITPDLITGEKYSVYYDCDYRFTLLKNAAGWKVSTLRKGATINHDVAAIVIKNIEAGTE